MRKPIIITKFPKKNLAGKICLSPYVSIEVDLGGYVRLCNCSGWMPTPVGNLFEQTIQEILSSQIASDIRSTIADGSYTYCNENTCGIMQSLPDNISLSSEVKELVADSRRYIMPREIVLAGDIVCNLSCPSCRKSIIKPDELLKEQYIELGQRLKQNLFHQPSTDNIRLLVSTSGEIFASPMLLSFISSISKNDFPNLELLVQTNGLMAEKNWEKLGEMQNSVSLVTVSVDAARPNTYEALRRGGNWQDIQKSLEWLSLKKHTDNFRFNLRMVVQKDNYPEIIEFYEMAKKLSVDRIEYTRITNWSTYTSNEFKNLDVFNKQHQDYAKAQSLIDQIKNDSSVWLAGGIF